MSAFSAQLWRELWEHPALYVTPIVIGVLLICASGMALVAAGGSGDVLQVVIHGINTADPASIGSGVVVGLISFLPAFLLPMAVIVTFYLLDCLSTERRDRSILFFKSLPVSDLTSVSAKIVTALFVAPAIAVAALIVSQLGTLLIVTVTLAIGNGGVASLWNPSRLLSVWAFAVYTVVASSLWYAPTYCFLLAVSAWARRAPLVWASSPLLLVLLELVLTGQSRLGRLLVAHLNGFWTTAFRHRFQVAIGEEQANEILQDTDRLAGADVWSAMDPVGLLTSATLWIGLGVAAAFVAAAVYIRRFRDDS